MVFKEGPSEGGLIPAMLPNQRVLDMVGSRIQIEMKGEKILLEGTLNGVDDYLNLFLTDTSEVGGAGKVRTLGSVILRGNNIVLIHPADPTWTSRRKS